ncbi:MAG: TonB-dependent receptor [Thiotrichaceae bacterium]
MTVTTEFATQLLLFGRLYITNFVGNGINRTEGQQDFIAFDYKLLNTPRWEVTIEGGYSLIDADMLAQMASQQEILALPPSVVTSGQVAAIERVYSKESAWNLGINGRYRLNEYHTFLAGLSVYQPNIDKIRQIDNYDITQFSNIISQKNPVGQLTYYENPPEIKLNPETSRDIIGLYLQDKYQISQQVNLTLGARYDHYSDFGQTFNPRVAVVYSHSDKTKFKWLYGEAFRAPAIRQTTAIGGLGNPNLKPEKIKTMELAWLQQHRNFQTTLTYFYSRASDRIDTILIPGTSNRIFENLAGNLDTAGWEGEISTELRKGLSLRAAYTLLQKTEENPRRFPKQTFSLIANYHYDDWDFNLNTFFHDSIQQQVAKNRFVDLSSYWLANGTIRYNLSNKITLVGKVENLFDQEYYSSSKITAFVEGVPNRGRTYALGMEVRF